MVGQRLDSVSWLGGFLLLILYRVCVLKTKAKNHICQAAFAIEPIESLQKGRVDDFLNDGVWPSVWTTCFCVRCSGQHILEQAKR